MTREELLASFEAAAARVVPLEGLGRLERLRAIGAPYAAYLLKRALAPRAAARLFCGARLRCGEARHSAALHLFGLLEAPAEVKLARWLIKTLKPDETFLDVGANFGFYSLLASELIDPAKGSAHAFEPVPWVNEALAANLRGTVARQHKLALSDKAGSFDFDQAPPTHPGGSTFDAAACLEPGSKLLDFARIKVEASTLDAFCAEHRLKPTLIKIDVEGAEDRVIAGGKRTLAGGNPAVVIEVWKPPVVNKTHRAAIAALKSLGYGAHVLTDGGGLAPLDSAGIERELSGGETANLVFKK